MFEVQWTSFELKLLILMSKLEMSSSIAELKVSMAMS